MIQHVLESTEVGNEDRMCHVQKILNPKYLVLSSGVFEISTPWALHLSYGVAWPFVSCRHRSTKYKCQ